MTAAATQACFLFPDHTERLSFLFAITSFSPEFSRSREPLTFRIENQTFQISEKELLVKKQLS